MKILLVFRKIIISIKKSKVELLYERKFGRVMKYNVLGVKILGCYSVFTYGCWKEIDFLYFF